MAVFRCGDPSIICRNAAAEASRKRKEEEERMTLQKSRERQEAARLEAARLGAARLETRWDAGGT